MAKEIKRVVVTGGAGQIAYSLLFRIASGELLGKDQPVALSILELEVGLTALKGVVMELEDGAFPLLKEVKIGSNPEEVFKDGEIFFLVGSKPRGPGMERKDLLEANGKIFVGQGKAINSVANKNAMVFVVGNPCNTNCLIALHHAPRLNPKHFFAMTRLDQNRASFQLAKKAGKEVKDVSNMIIWGNHSATQVPDYLHATIDGKKAVDLIQDTTWLQKEFFSVIQQRGAEIIKARGKSSAASAANASIDSIRSIFCLEKESSFSAGIYSKGNPYKIDPDLIFSFPLVAKAPLDYSIIDGLTFDEFLENKIRETEKELIEERDLVRSLLT